MNFADSKGALLLSLALQAPASFQAAKGQAGTAVTGVGDEAYEYPKAPGGGLPPFMLIFRQGPYGVMLTSFFEQGNRPRVPQAQLKELALVVIGQLPKQKPK